MYSKFDTVWKTDEMLLRNLINVVSNDGNLLLNFGPMGDGKLPDFGINSLNGIGKWMKMNGEAITSTKPWEVASENSNDASLSKDIDKNKGEIKDAEFDGTPTSLMTDIYFTLKDKTIYVILRSWKEKQLLVKSIRKDHHVKSLELLGFSKKN